MRSISNFVLPVIIAASASGLMFTGEFLLLIQLVKH